MEENYNIQNKLHDSKNNQWSNNVVAQYSDYWTAVSKWGSEVSRLTNAQDYDFVGVFMYDTYGRPVQSIYRDSRVAPEPVEE